LNQEIAAGTKRSLLVKYQTINNFGHYQPGQELLHHKFMV
jgi:hypothetical protein